MLLKTTWKRKQLLIPAGMLLTIVALISGYKIQQSFTKSHKVDFQSLHLLSIMAKDIYLTDQELKEKYPKAHFSTFNLKTTKGRAALISHEDQTYIVFRGTSNLREILTDLQFKKKRDKITGLWMHRGFLKEATEAYNAFKRQLPKDKPIIILGHSLGGAVAGIFTLHLLHENYQIDKLVTFGQPQFTTEEVIGKYPNLKYLRICNDIDIIPKVPPLTLISQENGRYRHFGDAVILARNNEYVYLEEIDASNIFINSAWGQLGSISREIEDHYMVNYVESIENKLDNSKEITYNTFIDARGK